LPAVGGLFRGALRGFWGCFGSIQIKFLQSGIPLEVNYRYNQTNDHKQLAPLTRPLS
jgi:hypothetical protein